MIHVKHSSKTYMQNIDTGLKFYEVPPPPVHDLKIKFKD